jgi:hypothetical protein
MTQTMYAHVNKWIKKNGGKTFKSQFHQKWKKKTKKEKVREDILKGKDASI